MATRTRVYRGGVLTAEGVPAADISRHVSDPAATVWLDLCDPTSDELTAMSDELGLHEVAVQEVLRTRQRPKLHRYKSHSFLNTYAVRLDPESGRPETAEIAAFLTRNALVTVRKSDRFDIDAVTARWDATAALAEHGVGFLLYGLLDYVVDGQSAAVQALDDNLETVEDVLFGEAPGQADVQRRAFRLRKDLVGLRRITTPMEEVVQELLSGNQLVSEPLMPYFRGIYDQTRRTTEWADSLRDLIMAVLETRLALQGNRLNTVMKQVTSWAAIIAVPTAITGFYGQNLPYPGFGDESGFVTSSVLIVTLSGGLYVAFKRKDWL
jgi:magnesium transporter